MGNREAILFIYNEIAHSVHQQTIKLTAKQQKM